MFCEWCGNQVTDWYKVSLPGDCCWFPVCQECVSAGEERGGGTAFCKTCGKIIPVRGATEVISYRKRSWWRKKIRITSWTCPGGCTILS